MPPAEFHFVTRWHVVGTVEEVTSVFRRGSELSRWWPAVYLESREVHRGDESGVGYVTQLHSKGWLPYTVRWRSRAVDVRHPHGFTIDATGDFEGRGTWLFEQYGDSVSMTYDWRIVVRGPLSRWGGTLLRPLFWSNHHWAMTRGEQSLKLELRRRRASSPEERAAVPAPPGPTTTSPLPLLLAAAFGLALSERLIHRARSRTGRPQA